MRPKSDDGRLESHTRGTPMGRIRPATLEEADSREDMLRPDAVLRLTGVLTADLSAFEAHVAALVDGTRPVARIRKKSGVSSADLRIALAGLCDRNLLQLVGIVVESVGEQAAIIKEDHNELAAAAAAAALDEFNENTMPGGVAGVVPAHVMAEIQSMIDEDD